MGRRRWWLSALLFSESGRDVPAAELSLNPRQAGLAPAANVAAMPVGILVALETLENVVAVVVAGLGSGSCRADGAHAATAQEHDQGFRIDLALQFGNEIRVAHTARVLVPLDLDGIGHPSDPIPLGAGTYIDQLGAGCELQQVVCFARCEFALVGAFESPAAFTGQVQDVG